MHSRTAQIYAAAEQRARDLGRSDEPGAILDLLAAEFAPRERRAITMYLATDTVENMHAMHRELGGRSDFSEWAHDLFTDLGAWAIADGEPVPACGRRWVAPKPAVEAAPRERTFEVKLVSEQPDGMVPVTVYRGGDLPEEMHWSTAVKRGLLKYVATYFVPMFEDFADQRYVEAVRRQHPEADTWLVYL